MVVAVKRDVGVLQYVLTEAFQAVFTAEGFALPDDPCLLYNSDAADDLTPVDFGGVRGNQKKNTYHKQSITNEA